MEFLNRSLKGSITDSRPVDSPFFNAMPTHQIRLEAPYQYVESRIYMETDDLQVRDRDERTCDPRLIPAGIV
jgi:hypothetical protein